MPVVALPTSKAPPGRGRVIIGTDVPSRVEVRGLQTWSTAGAGGHSPTNLEETTCQSTPCVLMLPYGDHELHFDGTRSKSSRTSTAKVVVKGDTIVVNHALGLEERSSEFIYGLTMLGVGVVGLLFTFAPLGLEISPDYKAARLLFFGALTVGGGVATCLTTTTRQEGSTTQWTPVPDPMTERNRGGIGWSVSGTF